MNEILGRPYYEKSVKNLYYETSVILILTGVLTPLYHQLVMIVVDITVLFTISLHVHCFFTVLF